MKVSPEDDKLARKPSRKAGGKSAKSKATANDHLERAIGNQLRNIRHQSKMTVALTAQMAGLSAGMLSKIERGAISPSLGTLRALAFALNVPITALFQDYEERREATHYVSGQGPAVDRRASRLGFHYQLLGNAIKRSRVAVEPYLITLDKRTDVTGAFQHEGVQFLCVMEGELIYRHGSKDFRLKPGDTLFFDAEVPHGPTSVFETPTKFLSISVKPRFDE